MQFHKIVRGDNDAYPHNGVHHWLWSGKEGKMNLKQFIEKFTCSDQVHSTQKEKYDELFQMRRTPLPDFVASQIKKLYEKNFINKNLIDEALLCCGAIIHDLGYEDFVFDDMSQVVNEEGIHNVMIIPGCQHPGMLEGRVLKAVRLVKQFNSNLTVIASGANPLKSQHGPEKITIENESVFILNAFNEMMTKEKVPEPPHFKKEMENESHDTPSNLENTLKKLDPTKRYNLIIVSSTFHLIKLAKFLETKLTDFYHCHDHCQGMFKHIMLIGAEKLQPKFKPERSGGYIKSMFVDILSELIDYQKKEESHRLVKNGFKDKLASDGYYIVRNGGTSSLHSIIRTLGEVIQVKDIRVQSESKKLSTTTKAMPLHTDHHMANHIAWLCIEAAPAGGETTLSDIYKAASMLSTTERDLLFSIDVKTVQLFEKDPERVKMVTKNNDRELYYFVPWLVDDQLNESQKRVVHKLTRLLDENRIEVKLEKDDILVLDNKRFAHGRKSFEGNFKRHLKRHWIK